MLGGRGPTDTHVPQAGLPLSSWCVSISCVPGSESGVARLRFGWVQGFAEDPQGVKAGHQISSPRPLSGFPHLWGWKVSSSQGTSVLQPGPVLPLINESRKAISVILTNWESPFGCALSVFKFFFKLTTESQTSRNFQGPFIRIFVLPTSIIFPFKIFS